jgi:hypothetical protein
MGTGAVVECQSCGIERSFNLGQGWSFGPGRAGLRVVDEPELTDALAILDAYPDADVEVQNLLYRCDACGEPRLHATVRITDGGELIHESKVSCSTCGSSATEITLQELLEAPCWVCREGEITQIGWVMWD